MTERDPVASRIVDRLSTPTDETPEPTSDRPRRLRTAVVDELARLAYYAYGELAETPLRLRNTYPSWDELSSRRRGAWLRAAGILLEYVREAEGAGAHENALIVIDRLLEDERAPWHR